MIFDIPNFYPGAGIFQVFVDGIWRPKKLENNNFIIEYKMSTPNIYINNQNNRYARMTIYFDLTKCTISDDNGLKDFKVAPISLKKFFVDWKIFMVDDPSSEFFEGYDEGIKILDNHIIKQRTTMAYSVQQKLSQQAGYEFEPHPSNPINRNIAEYAGLKSPMLGGSTNESLRALAKKYPFAKDVGTRWKDPLNSKSKGRRWTSQDLALFRKYQLEFR